MIPDWYYFLGQALSQIRGHNDYHTLPLMIKKALDSLETLEDKKAKRKIKWIRRKWTLKSDYGIYALIDRHLAGLVSY